MGSGENCESTYRYGFVSGTVINSTTMGNTCIFDLTALFSVTGLLYFISLECSWAYCYYYYYANVSDYLPLERAGFISANSDVVRFYSIDLGFSTGFSRSL